jgi:pimeloyl-ACP methyl ester carboxylesterase
MDRVDAYADWLAGSLAEVPAPRAIVGHALGAAIALQLALSHPDLADGLVLLAAGARLPVAEDALARARDDFTAECDRVARASLAREDPRVVARSRDAMVAAGAETLLGDYAACRAFDSRDRLGEVPQPVLVVIGAEDPFAPPSMGEELARGLPSAVMAVVPEAGHLLMLEQAGAVNLLVAGYLARLELTLDA